jgi:hypothetical protein
MSPDAGAAATANPAVTANPASARAETRPAILILYSRFVDGAFLPEIAEHGSIPGDAREPVSPAMSDYGHRATKREWPAAR